MRTQLLSKTTIIIGFLLLMFSCGESKKQFKIEGSVANADSDTLFLEMRGLSATTILDSIVLDKGGKFSFKQNTIGYPEFYRLRLGIQSIDISIDSTETVKISADKKSFATDYTVEGSRSSEKIKEAAYRQYNLNKSLNEITKLQNNKVLTDQQFIDSLSVEINKYKEEARNAIMADYMSLSAYFTLFQRIEGVLIFNTEDKKDLNMFRAIATVWDNYRSESPRSTQLKQFTLNAIAQQKALSNQSSTEEILNSAKEQTNTDFFTVSLPNVNGKVISTTDLKGKVVLLDFTVYQSEASIAHNAWLNAVYNKYKSKVEVYQVSFDLDKHAWQNAAVNLPWLTVRDEASAQSKLFGKFNIQGLPTTYILNKQGEIIKKLSAKDNIDTELSKVL